MRALIVGCGYVGLPLGQELRRAGHEVFGLRRSVNADAELREAGIQPVTADITRPETLHHLSGSFDWVIHCVAAGGRDPEAYRQLYVEGTRNLLRHLAPEPPQRFVYTSSTGVYAQDDGSWVDEESPTEPTSETGRLLREAEQVLLSAYQETRFPAILLRLAGIYGPGRGYWLKSFLSGTATLEGPGDRFLNMVHRDDVVAAVLAALHRGKPGEICNVVDDEPVRQRDLYCWLAETLHQPMPPSAAPPSGHGRRRATNKRISNHKLKTWLQAPLRYPTFRQGFDSVG
jgi:nucleoside-diphosphate-sugar epimerase